MSHAEAVTLFKLVLMQERHKKSVKKTVKFKIVSNQKGIFWQGVPFFGVTENRNLIKLLKVGLEVIINKPLVLSRGL